MKLSSITLPSNKSNLFLICFLLYSLSTIAQVSTSSPYSRYGIGDLAPSSLVKNMGLGGTEIGVTSSLNINAGNPAAYSDLFLTTFDIGVKVNQYELKTNSVKKNAYDASLGYFQFAFPIKPFNWSVGFGLQPYSNVGYSIIEKGITPTGDEERRKYTGSGGLNNFHIGTGKKFGKHLALGVDVQYLFGVVQQNKSVEFSSIYYMNVLDDRSTAIGWFHLNLGLQYTSDSLKFGKSDSLLMWDGKIAMLTDSLNKILASSASADYENKNLINQEIAQAKDLRSKVVERKKKSDWKFTLGLIGSPQADLNARETRVASSYRFFNYSTPNQVLIRDTAVYTFGDKKKVIIPIKLGLGFSFKKSSKWMFAGDYSMQQWKDFSYLGSKDSLFNSWKTSVGIQYIPNDRSSNRKYTNFISYRLGFHYEQTFLNVGTKKINDMGVAIGFGLPIGKTATNVHLSIEAGQRGSLSFNPIQEKYIKFGIGVTINDRWFVKPKYD